jgi:cell division protein FtsZ
MAKKEIKKEFNFPLTNIKVIGVGGAGNNGVSRMSQNFPRGVEFIAINTDHQDLDYCEVKKKIYIGRNLTRGLGTGMNPELGRQAAEENRSEIAEAVKGADIVFIAAGFGGGTGTGVSPVVAEAAKQAGALTLAFVTKPFAFEGQQRQRIAEEGIAKIKDKVDALIVVPNDRIFTVIDKDTPVLKAFETIDEILKNALQGIVELIIAPGIVNVDYADVRAIIQDAGSAIVGVGIASGQERAVTAVNQALNSPLLEVSPEGAHGVLLSISGGRDLKMTEINEAAKIVAQTVDPGAKIIFGAYFDKHLKPNQVKITLIATGFHQANGGNSLFAGTGPAANNGYFNDTTTKKDYFAPAKTDFGAREEKQSRFPEPGMREREKPNPMEEFGPAKRGREERLEAQPEESAKMNVKNKKSESDVWDIPTFLRRRKK